MKFYDLMNGLIETLKNYSPSSNEQTIKLFRQVEEYDGQLQNLEDFEVIPPACFVEIDNSDAGDDIRAMPNETVYLNLYIITSKLSGSIASVYDIRDKLISLLHNKVLLNPANQNYVCKTYFKASLNIVNLPGVKVWQMQIIAK